MQIPDVCSWPIAEIANVGILVCLSSALERTAELSSVRVMMAAYDPKPNSDRIIAGSYAAIDRACLTPRISGPASLGLTACVC